ncbi:MAG: hypothetical protein ACJATR_000023 [Halopseudomonas sp.]|jgi:hypothetical protein
MWRFDQGATGESGNATDKSNNKNHAVGQVGAR